MLISCCDDPGRVGFAGESCSEEAIDKIGVSSDIGEVDSDAVMEHEGSREEEEAMTDGIAECGEAMSDGNGEQDKTKENTTNDEFTVQEGDNEEFSALNAEQGES